MRAYTSINVEKTPNSRQREMAVQSRSHPISRASTCSGRGASVEPRRPGPSRSLTPGLTSLGIARGARSSRVRAKPGFACIWVAAQPSSRRHPLLIPSTQPSPRPFRHGPGLARELSCALDMAIHVCEQLTCSVLHCLLFTTQPRDFTLGQTTSMSMMMRIMMIMIH